MLTISRRASITEYFFLHTQRPSSDVDKVRAALEAAGYKSIFDPSKPERDPYGSGVDYSIKDSTKDYQSEAQRIADAINKGIGSNLKPQPQSVVPAGYFGVWF